MPSLFGFAPGGVYLAANVAIGAVRSYRTISTWPYRNTVVYFLWHCPLSVISAGSYPAPFLAGARTFLPHAVTHMAAAARPSGTAYIAPPPS